MICNYSIDNIIRYSQGLLSKDDQAEVLRHIESCEECCSCYRSIVSNGGSVKFYGRKQMSLREKEAATGVKKVALGKKGRFLLFPHLTGLKSTLRPVLIALLVCAAAYFLIQSRHTLFPTSANQDHNEPVSVIAALSQYKIKLYSKKAENDMYRGMVLDMDGTQRFVDWSNETNPSYAPQLVAADLNADGHMELAIILTTGSGTGVHEEEIHIVGFEDMLEMDVENPIHIIKKNVKTELDSEAIKVSIGKKNWKMGKEYLENIPEDFLEDVYFGNILRYSISENRLRAAIPAQIGTSTFIGEVLIEYTYQNELFQMKEIDFEPYVLR